jgi:hypothetical protein
MNQNILQQIAQVDEKLTILRESWMDSKPEKKWKWMAKIDAELDERSKLMKIRDGQLVSDNVDVDTRRAGTPNQTGS